MENNRLVETKVLGDIDPTLQRLVYTINMTHISIKLTLLVGGLMISGTAISGREFFEEQARRHHAIQPQGFGLVLERFVEEYPAKVEGALRQVNDEQLAEKVDLTTQIHLKDVHIWFGPNVSLSGPSSADIMWRGRLSAIDGFIMGTFTMPHS